MGNQISHKLWFIAIIFFITACSAAFLRSPSIPVAKPPLVQFLNQIEGYSDPVPIPLDERVYQRLKLDDYIFSAYKKKDAATYLYIGFYNSPTKAYSSHSPLICYPSHGWKIIRPAVKKKLILDDNDIHYNEVITAKGSREELVIFWYQANLFTNTDIYLNKIDMAYNRFMKSGEQHAFVRISVPMQNSSYEEACLVASDFIKRFYPHFVEFLTYLPAT
jgi:EpsI family protein